MKALVIDVLWRVLVLLIIVGVVLYMMIPKKPTGLVTAWDVRTSGSDTSGGSFDQVDSFAVDGTWVSPNAELWYDPELGRFGVIGVGNYTTLSPLDKDRFEKWMAKRPGLTYMVGRGNGIYEAPLPK